MPKDDKLYRLLGVDPGATPEEIKRAYRKTAMIVHPDHGGDKETFNRVRLAREILRDKNRRERYDRTGDASETVVDNDLAQAMELLSQLVMGALEFSMKNDCDILSLDILGSFKNTLRVKIKEFQESIDGNLVAIRSLERLAKKFNRRQKKKKDDAQPPNILRNVVDGNIRLLKTSNDQARDKIRHIEIAIGLIDDHTFERSAASMFRNMTSSGSTTTFSG